MKQTKNLGARITELVTDIAFLTEASNVAQCAYDPSSKPFGPDATQDILNNIPALRAVINGSLGIVTLRKADLEDGRLQVLRDMADGKLNEVELTIARLFANATWWTRNATRDLARTARPICMDYAVLLTPLTDLVEEEKRKKEVAKDDYLIVAMAKLLLSKLN